MFESDFFRFCEWIEYQWHRSLSISSEKTEPIYSWLTILIFDAQYSSRQHIVPIYFHNIHTDTAQSGIRYRSILLRSKEDANDRHYHALVNNRNRTPFCLHACVSLSHMHSCSNISILRSWDFIGNCICVEDIVYVYVIGD